MKKNCAIVIGILLLAATASAQTVIEGKGFGTPVDQPRIAKLVSSVRAKLAGKPASELTVTLYPQLNGRDLVFSAVYTLTTTGQFLDVVSFSMASQKPGDVDPLRTRVYAQLDEMGADDIAMVTATIAMVIHTAHTLEAPDILAYYQEWFIKRKQ